MIVYKLTDQNYMTLNNTKWGINVNHSKPPKDNPELCSSDILHYYKSPALALLLNPLHADIINPVLWESEAEKEAVSDWGKSGCFSLTTKKIIRTQISDKQINRIMVRFAILCAESVLYIYHKKYPNDERVKNAIDAAKEYLNNTRRAARAARAADAAEIDFNILANKAFQEEFKEKE